MQHNRKGEKNMSHYSVAVLTKEGQCIEILSTANPEWTITIVDCHI